MIERRIIVERNGITLGRVLFLLFAILYVISPIDAVPGPIDDIIVVGLPLLFNRISDD